MLKEIKKILKHKKFIIDQRGFTLIEMLIVISIIAILSSVFLVGLSGFRQSAYDTRRISDLQKVQTYLESYYNGNISYPIVSGTDWGSLNDDLNVSTFPDDPIPTQHYVYCSAADGQSYILAAKLAKDNNDSYQGDTTGYSCTAGTPDCGTGWFCVKP